MASDRAVLGVTQAIFDFPILQLKQKLLALSMPLLAFATLDFTQLTHFLLITSYSHISLALVFQHRKQPFTPPQVALFLLTLAILLRFSVTDPFRCFALCQFVFSLHYIIDEYWLENKRVNPARCLLVSALYLLIVPLPAAYTTAMMGGSAALIAAGVFLWHRRPFTLGITDVFLFFLYIDLVFMRAYGTPIQIFVLMMTIMMDHYFRWPIHLFQKIRENRGMSEAMRFCGVNLATAATITLALVVSRMFFAETHWLNAHVFSWGTLAVGGAMHSFQTVRKENFRLLAAFRI